MINTVNLTENITKLLNRYQETTNAFTSLTLSAAIVSLWLFAIQTWFPGSMPILSEIIGTWLVLSCVHLIVKQNMWNWIFGIIGVAFFGYALFQYGLYSTAVLNIVYYIPVQFYGWYKWLYGGENNGRLEHPTWMTWSQRLMSIVAISIVTVAWGYLMQMLGASFAFLDALVLAISVTSQFLLSFKKVESWIGWVTVDVLSVYMFASAGSVMAAALYVVFFFLASSGLYSWYKNREIK